ncbi:MAG TPA: alpha/beta hydrolase, partial [Thermoanaerobaculia bacterium]|nr:alpha/beta hydrolase [Thermoanaerobaculia bacterium]
MASRELTLILSALKARGNDRAGQSVAESRRDFAAIVRLCPAPPEVTVEAVDAGGVPAEWLLPPGAEPG